MTTETKNLGPDDRLRVLPDGKNSPRCGPAVRAHESVLAAPREELRWADIVRRTKEGDNGGQWLQEKIRELGARRADLAARRRTGERVSDPDAEGLSFAAVGSKLPDLQRKLDFQVQLPDTGEERATVSTSAFVLATSAMAVADINTAFESVPTISDDLVMDLDDNNANTEIAAALEFAHIGNLTDTPKALNEEEQYREVGAGEDRYTGLTFKDGYQRAFSQTFIERAPAQIFSQLSDLGQGAREVMEWISIGWLMDYWGSRGSNQTLHSLYFNRTATSLFSTTANTPGTGAPSGTRIENNALVDPTNLTTLRERLASMRSGRNMPVANWPEVIMVPDARWEEAWAILQSAKVPGIFNEENFWGPNGPGATRLYSSPMIDLFSTVAWYGGRPTRQFMRKWATRPEVVVHGGSDTLPYLHTREGFRVRIGWDMRLFCRDYRFWVENLEATTAPGGA